MKKKHYPTSSTLALYNAFGSKKTTGSSHRIEDNNNPLASAGDEGITTRSPGV
jgi:hypothetical protein